MIVLLLFTFLQTLWAMIISLLNPYGWLDGTFTFFWSRCSCAGLAFNFVDVAIWEIL